MNLNDMLNRLNGNADPDVAVLAPLSAGVLAGAMAEYTKKQSEKLGVLAVGVLENIERTVGQAVANLRAIRKQERDAKTLLDEINLAAKYFAATGNPLPYFKATGNTHGAYSFCERLGVDVPSSKDPLWSVPAGWTAPQDPPAAA